MKKEGKRILVVSQYFYPERFRINDLCSEWVNKGYQVTVLTGIPNYPKGKFYSGYGYLKKRKEIWNGMEIIRIPICPRGNSKLGLCLNYLSFVVSGFFWVAFSRRKADYVFNYEVSPMTQVLVGVWYAKKHKIPCYLYVTDLWPENVEIITGNKSRLLISPIEKMVGYIYRHCTRIFTSSNSFIDAISKRGIDSNKLEYWPQYAEDFYQKVEAGSVSEIKKDNRFNIIFAGNIGKAQGLEILPKTALLLKEKNAEVCFTIVGDGRFKKELVNLVNDCKVADMFSFVEEQPAIRIPEFIASCDATLICLGKSEVFAITIPAKTQSYLACGKPVVVSASGEVQQIIREANCGVCSDAGDEVKLAEAILELTAKTETELIELGENAIKYSQNHFNKQDLLERMDRYFSL